MATLPQFKQRQIARRSTSDIVVEVEAEKRDIKTLVNTPDRLPDKDISLLDIKTGVLIPRSARVRAISILEEGE